jgi:hypothetical protein
VQSPLFSGIREMHGDLNRFSNVYVFRAGGNVPTFRAGAERVCGACCDIVRFPHFADRRLWNCWFLRSASTPIPNSLTADPITSSTRVASPTSVASLPAATSLVAAAVLCFLHWSHLHLPMLRQANRCLCGEVDQCPMDK